MIDAHCKPVSIATGHGTFDMDVIKGREKVGQVGMLHCVVLANIDTMGAISMGGCVGIMSVVVTQWGVLSVHGDQGIMKSKYFGDRSGFSSMGIKGASLHSTYCLLVIYMSVWVHFMSRWVEITTSYQWQELTNILSGSVAWYATTPPLHHSTVAWTTLFQKLSG